MRKERGDCRTNFPYFMFYALFWMATAFVDPYLSMFLSSKGLSGTQIGMINSSLYIVSILAAVLSGMAADRIKTAKPVLLVLLLGGLAATQLIKCADGMKGLFLACVAYGFCAGPPVDLTDKIVIENEPSIRAKLSFNRTGGALGYLIASLAAGAVVEASGFETSINFYFVFMMCGILVALLMKERKLSILQKDKTKFKLADIGKNKKSPFIYTAMTVWGIVFTGALSFISFYVVKMGESTGLVAILIAAAMAGQITSGFLLQAVYRRVRKEICVGLGIALLSVRLFAIAMCALLPPPILIVFTYLGGFSEPLLCCSIITIIGETFPKSVSATAQTLKSVANRGIGSAMGTLVIGRLFDLLDPFAVMMGVSAGCLLVGILMALWGRSVKE